MSAGAVTVLAALAVGLPGCAIAVLRHRYVAVRVQGSSMSPTYAAGEIVLIRRTRHGLRVGDVVVVESPADAGESAAPATPRWLIKRVAAVGGEAAPAAVAEFGRVVPPDTIVILGDSPVRGYDSRSIGFLPTGRVLGVAVRPRPSATSDPAAASSAAGLRTSRSTSDERGPR